MDKIGWTTRQTEGEETPPQIISLIEKKSSTFSSHLFFARTIIFVNSLKERFFSTSSPPCR
jgi:hypothetical protein